MSKGISHNTSESDAIKESYEVSPWQDRVAHAVEQLFSHAERKASHPGPVETVDMIRLPASDGSEVTLWRLPSTDNNHAHPLSCRIDVKSPDRFAVSTTGEVAVPSELRRYELRQDSGDRLHIYREVTGEPGLGDQGSESVELLRLVEDLDAKATEESATA
jgi:hypothetical protein